MNLKVSSIKGNLKKTIAHVYDQNNNNKCLVSNNIHNKSYGKIEFLKDVGGCTVECLHKECEGNVLNNEMIMVDKKYFNMLFQGANIVINNNHNVTNNIYNNNTEEEILICDDYIIFEDEILNKLIIKSLNNTSGTIAEVFYHLNKEHICYTEDKKWHIFENNLWRITKKIRRTLSDCLTNYYIKVLKYYEDLDLNKKNNSKTRKITELINGLTKTTIRNNILTELADIYVSENSNFKSVLNTKNNLIGFENGVFDLDLMQFREGIYTDYISHSTKYEFKQEFSENKEQLLRFLEDIQPNKKQLHYLLKFLSTCLFGKNKIEKFHIFQGIGRNGKSKLIELISHTFGDYYVSIQSQLLTKEQPSASNPRPEILTLKGKRIVCASEPENNQKLNTSFIKFLSGNDILTARALFENEIVSFIPQFSMILLCNDVPLFDNQNDHAMWERCRYINFPITFVDNPMKENQKKIDYNLSDKLLHWKEDFILLLIDYYKLYIKEGLLPEQSVLKFTNEIKDEQNIYKQYMNERTEPAETHIHTIMLYEDFKKWFLENNFNECIPNNKIFVKQLQLLNYVYKVVKDNNSKSVRGFEHIKFKK
jgi:P4 family phage/plasmid primase-like protien